MKMSKKYTTPKENSGWFKKKRSSWNKGLTKETDPRVAKSARKERETKRQQWKDPEYRKVQGEKIRKAMMGKKQTKESNEKRSKTLKGRKKPKSHGRNVSKALKGRTFSKEWINKIVEGLKKYWRNSDRVERQRQLGKERWQNPEFVAKQMVLRKLKPNKPEKFLTKLLEKLFPNEWKYVGGGGDKKAIIGGKCPDFININEQRKVIEIFGNYWHGEIVQGIPKKQHEQERANHFAKHGYQTLVIWDYELKDMNKLLLKLKKFLEEVESNE